MILNSHSSKKKKKQQKRSIKLKSSKRNIINAIKLQEKSQNYISKFQLNSLSKKKNKKIVNKILKNNELIIYTSLPNTLNIFKDGKSSDNLDENSTFIFSGDFESHDENNQIIDNYLKRSNVKTIFDCKSISTISNKEDYEIIFSKENSFTLSSSKSSLNSEMMSTKIKESNNQKLMSILKKINSSSNHIESDKHSNISKIEINNDKKNYPNALSNAMTKELKENEIKKKIKIKRKKSKKIYFVLFIFINFIFYVGFIMKLFEPSVEKLFYDNDHDNFIYTTSLLSLARSLAKK